MDPQYITVGNSKLKKFGGASFDLPAGRTCPKKGECFSVCYAVKLARIYKGYADKVERNLKLSRTKGFVESVSQEIEKFGPKYFRIHGGGDFYNQAYLDKWVEIIKKFPKVRFYAYTKSLHLQFPKLKNFTVIKSRGGKLDHLIKSSDYQSVILPLHSEVPKGYVEDNQNDLWWLDSKKVGLRKH